MEIRLAEAEELEAVYTYYNEVIAHQKLDAYSPDWKKDIYPTKEDLLYRIDNHQLYLGLIKNRIIAAAAMTQEEDPIYYEIDFPHSFPKENIGVWHLVSCHPDFRGKNITSELLNSLLNTAKASGLKAIHLDTMPGNEVADRLYLRLGFEFIGIFPVFYEDTGTIHVRIFEKIL